MSVIGRVRTWHPEEGWGVLDSEQTPGGCWAHFSVVMIRGFRELFDGRAVEFEWEHAQQDGYDFRAVSVWPQGAEPQGPATDTTGTSAYRSHLVIGWDG